MSIRTLFAALAALALLFAPALAGAGPAFAAAPDHHMKMMEVDHCTTPPAGTGDHHEDRADDCCISMCMPAAVAPTAPEIAPLDRPARPMFSVPAFLVAYLGEIATPPPRSA